LRRAQLTIHPPCYDLHPPDESFQRRVEAGHIAAAGEDADPLHRRTAQRPAAQPGRGAEEIDVTGQGRKQVDVERFYDRERYHPSIVGVMGLPMFLC
jgi:hypothetical protein